MLLYRSRFRTSTLIVRIFITALAVILFLTGLLAVVGMLKSQTSETGSVVFVFMTLTIAFIIFKSSGWNIRRYVVFDDHLEIRIFGGLRTMSLAVSSLVAFNDLAVLTASQDSGIGIITADNKIIKVHEIELRDFPEFILQLQKIVKWDLTLKYDGQA